MNPVKVFRQGAANLRRALTIATGADGEATRAAAAVLVREIRKRAPVDDAGDGQRFSGAKRKRRPGTAKRGVRQAKVDGVRRVGTDDFVSPFIEFGVPNRGKHGAMPAHPFFRPGLMAAQPQMGRAVASELQTNMAGLIEGGPRPGGRDGELGTGRLRSRR